MEIRKGVELYNGEARVGTFFIAQGFKKEHRLVLELVQKYQSEFEDSSRLNRCKSRPKKGKGPPINEYMLTEEQTAFLGMLFRNNPQVVKFKHKLVKDFFRMRRVLENIKAQHKNAEWIENRKEGKIPRLKSTDTMKEFIEYAKKQGSENADWYYTNLTKMLNDALGIAEKHFPNLRDLVTSEQLLIISGGDLVIKKALIDGMKKKTYYKDIFKLAKERTTAFAALYDKFEIMDPQLKLFQETAVTGCSTSQSLVIQ